MEKFGVNLLWTSRYHYDIGRKLNQHTHDYFQIIYFLDGEGLFACEDVSYSIKSGSLFFIRPKQRHGFIPHAYGRVKTKTLDIKFGIDNEQLIQMIKRLPMHLMDTTAELKQLLERIQQEGRKKALFYRETACLRLAQILYMLCRKASESEADQSEPQAREAVQTKDLPSEASRLVESYIMEHYHGALTLGIVAEQICYSKSYIRQTIKNNYGCSFTDYLQKIRIEQAKQLILCSDHSLKQIAERVGFKTVYHFNRVFKQVEGISPGQWKHQELKGICKAVVFD